MELTKAEKAERLAEYLNGKWEENYRAKRKTFKRYSISKWSQEIGLPNKESLLAYMDKTKYPGAENKLIMGKYFGSEFFLVIGESQEEQENILKQLILENYPDLTIDDQNEILDIIQKAKKRKRPGDNKVTE